MSSLTNCNQSLKKISILKSENKSYKNIVAAGHPTA